MLDIVCKPVGFKIEESKSEFCIIFARRLSDNQLHARRMHGSLTP